MGTADGTSVPGGALAKRLSGRGVCCRFIICFTKRPRLPAKRIELSVRKIDLNSKNLPEISGISHFMHIIASDCDLAATACISIAFFAMIYPLLPLRQAVAFWRLRYALSPLLYRVQGKPLPLFQRMVHNLAKG